MNLPLPDAGRMVLKLLTEAIPLFSLWNSYREKAPSSLAPEWRMSTTSSTAMLPHMETSIVRERLVTTRKGLLFS